MSSADAAHSSEPSMSTKVVHSGQQRHYYAAMCMCGWSGPYRVTRERARDDFAAHLAAFVEQGQ